jgi:EmrB/QacA subfamily drug resistance transporter
MQAPQPAPEREPFRRRAPSPRTVLGIASLGVSVAFVDATIVNIAFPDIARSFDNSSIASLSWVLNAYNIVFAAFLVAAGRIADLLGRRRIFIGGLELFTAASLLCAVAPSPATLIAFRVVQALGAALLVPSSLALVLQAFPVEHRSHGVALLSAVSAVAAGLGPSLGGLLVAAGDWRLVFLVNLPIGLVAVLLARRHLVESRAPGRRRMPDLPGALMFAVAIAALVLGVVKGQQWGWGGPAVIGSFAAAVVIGAVFVRRCTWHRSPLIDLSLLRIRTFAAGNAMTVVGAAGFFGYTLTNVLFLTGIWHYSVLQAGLALTPGPFVAAAIAGPTSRLVQRVGHRPVLVTGGLIWGGAVFWLVERVGTTPDFFGEWLPGIVLLGIGAGTLFPNLSSASVASAPGESFATATGMNAVARQVGAALGVAIVVAIIGTPSPLHAAAAFDHAWTFTAVCLILAGLGCLFVERIQSEAETALGDAARAVLRLPDPSPQPHPAAPAERRPFSFDGAGVARAESTSDFLAHVPLFAGLEPALRASLAERASTIRLRAGEQLFAAGDEADAMHIVRAGRLQVLADGDGSAIIRELGRGDAVGELALLTSSPRSATVRAARDSDLMTIGRADFDRLLDESPAMSRALNRLLGERLREVRSPGATSRPLPATVALVALGGTEPVREVAAGLARALSRHTRVAVLAGHEIAPPEPGTEPASAYGPLLDRAEGGNDLVVLVGAAAFGDDLWTRFCLQQADRILALGSGGEPPHDAAEHAALRGCDLVAHGVAAGSGALAGWASALEPIETHALRSTHMDADLACMARRLTGNSVGIVLSGGGARAFSHIGVLEELVAAGMTIDRVAGVSMGAFVGAMFAMGMDADEMDARCYEEWVRRRPLGDLTLPRYGLIRGHRAEAMLKRTFGETAIEELERSFFCACGELRRARLVVTRSGPLWEAVAFSVCIPVLAPPQVRGRDLFIDGSLIDNLPVGTMADLNEGPIVAVDVKATFDSQDGQARPRRERVPLLGETLTRVLLLGSANTSDAARAHADLIIKPRNEGVGLLEFHQIDAAREAGRAAAREALEQGAVPLLG